VQREKDKLGANLSWHDKRIYDKFKEIRTIFKRERIITDSGPAPGFRPLRNKRNERLNCFSLFTRFRTIGLLKKNYLLQREKIKFGMESIFGLSIER